MKESTFYFNWENSDNPIYNGKSFRYIEDFEREFKPTKWSIRKFIAFTNSFDSKFKSSEVQSFVDHTISVLKRCRSDKDTVNFIRQIKNKRTTHFYYWLGNDTYNLTTELKVPKKSSNQLIKIMVFLKKEGIIEGSGKNIAEVLKNNFKVNLSLSTIQDKIYKFSEELNEESSYSEIFKNFQNLSKDLK